MTFFSRPDLSNLQFKQLSDSELHLSGTTYFVKTGGIEIANGSGNTIPIIATGATSGHVLTYLDGEIKLAPVGSTSDLLFDSNRSTSRSGIPVVTVSGSTVNQFLEGYFFPAVGPSSSLSIVTGGSSREFGDSAVGNLCYQAIRETNKICGVAINNDGITGYDVYPVTDDILGDCCNTIAYTYPNNCTIPPTGTSQTSVSFQVCVQDTSSLSSVSTASISWRNKKFVIKSSTLYSNDAITTILSGGELSTTINKTLSNQSFSDQFFYYVYPSSFGTPSFTVNGLPNNAWGNISTGTLFKFDYTNAQGYENQYYVARSDSRITGTYNIVIS